MEARGGPVDARGDDGVDAAGRRRPPRAALLRADRTHHRRPRGSTRACSTGVAPTKSPGQRQTSATTRTHHLRDLGAARARARQAKKQFGAEMDDDAGKLPRPQTTTHPSGYHFTEASQYGSGARATLPGRRRTCHGSLSAALRACLLVQQPLWERRAGSGNGHGGRVRVTQSTRRVGAYGRTGWLVTVRGRSAAARRDSRWRRRGNGLLDDTMSPVACGRVSSRIMICVFLGTDSRVAAGFFELWPWCFCWRRYPCCCASSFWNHCTSVSWTRAGTSARFSRPVTVRDSERWAKDDLTRGRSKGVAATQRT